MVLYLKYRPQKASDLFGQQAIIGSLQNALSVGKLSHAYLFCGPRGVGKTSTARILAKMVNCLSAADVPCNTCEACTSITDGSCLDVIEIDAASNRGIDDIRTLREKIKLSPTSLKKKVYIIDEVHMLTNEAFNALLKTLEEPPSHVLFILATTEVHKVPQTILSRVTRMDFKEGGLQDLTRALKRVVDGEKIDIDEEALTLLAKKSDGSFRDAIKLLDQLSSRGEKITAELVEESLRGGSFETLTALINLLIKKDAKGALELLDKEASSGANLKEFTLSLMDILRSLLLLKHGVIDLVKDSFSEEKFQALSALSTGLSTSQILDYINFFQRAFEGLKVTSLPLLPLEVAVVESCQEGIRNQVSSITEEMVAKEVALPVEKLAAAPAPSTKPSGDKSTQSNDLAVLKDKWSYILEVIKPYNFSLEAMLHSVDLDSIDGDRVILKVPYSFHQRILETPRNRDLLESVLADVLQKPIKVGCILEQHPLRVEELQNVELAADDEVIKLAAEIFSEGAN